MPPILSKLPAELNDLVFKFIPVTFRRTLKNVALSCKDGFRRSYAKMHNTVVLRGVGIEQGEMTPDMCNPARTFEELIELAHWCVNIPPFAKILAIRGPTSRYHTEHMAQGVALCEEEISSCQVCEVLELFPDVERLIIDNVAWADCDPNNDPDCTAGMDRRVFEGITIRAVERNCHYGHPYAVLEAVKIVAHLVLGTLHGYVGDVDLSDTQVDWLTLDEVGYFDPYQFAALATLEPNSVERLDLFGMGASRVPSVMELLAAQKDSVKTLAFDIATPVISKHYTSGIAGADYSYRYRGLVVGRPGDRSTRVGVLYDIRTRTRRMAKARTRRNPRSVQSRRPNTPADAATSVAPLRGERV